MKHDLIKTSVEGYECSCGFTARTPDDWHNHLNTVYHHKKQTNELNRIADWFDRANNRTGNRLLYDYQIKIVETLKKLKTSIIWWSK